MAKQSDQPETSAAEEEQKPAAQPGRRGQREIPGNLPYLTASGTLKKVLDRIIEAQRPDRFSVDFLENVLKLTGGSARATIPILKRMGFLQSEGTPTDLYSRFKTEGGRSAAALAGLQKGWAEIFKRSEYAHAADNDKIKDIIVEITGLKKNDPVASAIRNTFNTVKSYVKPGTEASAEQIPPAPEPQEEERRGGDRQEGEDQKGGGIRLAYNINIVLPETSDLAVLNAIFRSIEENLLR